MGDRLQSALDLMRRMPPNAVEANLKRLIALAPDLSEDLLCSIDQPLKAAVDTVEGREFLQCDYNRDGNSYRSPWSNKYYPPVEDTGAPYPSAELRQLEKAANDAFDTYRDLYYEGGLSSVYVWSLDPGFAACVLFHKQDDRPQSGGIWDSIHIVEVQDTTNSKASYKLTSTIMLFLDSKSEQIGNVNLAGNLTRRLEKELDVNDNNTHLMNIGRLIEEVENKLRLSLNDIYFSKTQEVLNYLHKTQAFSDTSALMGMQAEIHRKIATRQRD
eukprot:TRINITY_DN15054_c0_g1_i1.p1 TRINITY_DN15054_c0_g1~~TRINITY_DN15054_c0_g1_i1.p1  ORF type:complete len:290 (-),score=48.25 TRINITY_DN15054_c0_g1_i1:46-861(-)